MQECAKLQRYHPPYWINLSVAYCALCNTTLDCGIKTDSGAAGEEDGHTEQLKSILSHTVALFRPYFGRWRREEAMLQFNGALHSSIQISQASVKDPIEESWHSCGGSEMLRGIESSSMAAAQSAEGEAEDTTTAMMTSHATTAGSLVHQDAMATMEHSLGKMSHDVRQNMVSPTVGDTVTTLKNGQQACIHGGDMALPFSLLVSANVSIKDFVEQLMKLPQERVQELLGYFFEMSSCSCLIWARFVSVVSSRFISPAITIPAFHTASYKRYHIMYRLKLVPRLISPVFVVCSMKGRDCKEGLTQTYSSLFDLNMVSHNGVCCCVGSYCSTR